MSSSDTPVAGVASATVRPPAAALEGFQRRFLRARAQPLKALVFVGAAGPTPGVLDAIDRALLDHELVKVRMRGAEDRDATAQQLADATGAALCGVIGFVAILYRAHPESPRLVLPAREA